MNVDDVSGDNETLVVVGIIFAFCLSFYITGIMARRLWHRYQSRVSIVSDRVVRKQFSSMYTTMLSRIASHKEWKTLMETSPSLEGLTPSPTPRHGALIPTSPGWEWWLRWRVQQHVNCSEIQLLMPHEIDNITFHCQKEVRRRFWFVRRQTINETVERCCTHVYREYWTSIITDYTRMLAWVNSTRG